jgi:hypothetical protein
MRELLPVALFKCKWTRIRAPGSRGESGDARGGSRSAPPRTLVRPCKSRLAIAPVVECAPQQRRAPPHRLRLPHPFVARSKSLRSLLLLQRRAALLESAIHEASAGHATGTGVSPFVPSDAWGALSRDPRVRGPMSGAASLPGRHDTSYRVPDSYATLVFSVEQRRCTFDRERRTIYRALPQLRMLTMSG